jgi:hypothetical protein
MVSMNAIAHSGIRVNTSILSVLDAGLPISNRASWWRRALRWLRG